MKYLKRSSEGIVVIDKKTRTYTIGVKHFINELCLRNLSTFEGRVKASSKVLNVGSNVPVYVNENMILFPTKSLRNYDCIYINFLRVLNVEEGLNGLNKVIFDDLTEVNVNVSITKIKRQMVRSNIIYEYIYNR